MRQILSQDEIAKKEKTRNTIISIVLLVIMLASTAGFAFIYNSDGTKNNANSGNIQNQGNSWVSTINGQQFVFSTSTESINATKINIIPDLNQYYNKPLYIDTSNPGIYSELASTLGRFSQRIQYACYNNCENSSYAQKNCSDNLIVVTESNDNKVYQNKSCAFIEGDMRSVDSFLYRMLGVA